MALRIVAGIALTAVFQQFVCAQQQPLPGSVSYKAPAGFPTSLFPSYYHPPVATQEPAPVVFDEALNETFPFNMTDPSNIPNNTNDPVYYPPTVVTSSNASTSAFLQGALQQVQGIITGSSVTGNCSKCIAALNVGKLVAQVGPQQLPPLFISLCESTGFASSASCQATYSAQALGSVWTQVLAYADVSGQDGLYICSSLSSTFCAAPKVNQLNTTGLFPKPKPANATAPAPSGKRIKALHLSDLHIDPRYFVSSEANCSSSFCCRTNVKSNGPNGTISLPASLYGAFKCDTPWDLLAAAMQSIDPLTGINEGKNFGIYTGDSTAHDPANEISRAYTEFCENAVYNLIKSYVKVPIYAALGNHDTS